MLAFLNRSVTIWLLCHNKKPSLCRNGYTGTHFIYGLQNQRAKSQQYPKFNLKNSQVNILDAYSLKYLKSNLPIIPEVTLKGHQAGNTNKNTKLEDFIYFQSWRSTYAKYISSFSPLSFWKKVKLSVHWRFFNTTLLLCNKHAQEAFAQLKQNESFGKGESCGEGRAALPCQKWEISLIYCTKERQKGRRDPLIKCSPFEPCLICWLITGIRSCNKQRPFQTMMPICYGSTLVLELPAATSG